MLGPRLGKYTKDKDGKVTKVNAIQGHSITLGALGCFILWFGWYGFNGAAATNLTQLGMIFATTTVAPAVATCTTLIFTWVKNKKPDVSMCLNAGLAGLVGITAGCANLDIIGATIVGIVSGILVVVVVDVCCHCCLFVVSLLIICSRAAPNAAGSMNGLSSPPRHSSMVSSMPTNLTHCSIEAMRR